MAELLTGNAKEKIKPTELELLLEMRLDIRRLLNQIGSREHTSIHDAIAVLERELRDPLTNLSNRRAFATRAAEFAASNTPYVIALLDLDNFKAINDQFGHARGDDLLVAIAEIVRKSLSRADLVARLGGDEFVAIFREAPPESVVKLINEFLVALPNDVIAAGLPAINASCGVSNDRIESIDLKLRDAERALHRAKRDGGGHAIPTE